MADLEAIVQLALSQRGKRYVFGAQPADGDPNPRAFDCSSLVRWSCNRLGLAPAMQPTSYYQEIHCASHGTTVGVDQGIATRGALLFNHRDLAGNLHTPTPPVNPAIYSHAHVAISLGNGQTIEARSTAVGVVIGTANGRGWTAAGRIPGAGSGWPPPPPPPPPPPTPPPAPGFPDARTDRPYLRHGAVGPSVVEMQRLLIATGQSPALAAAGATGNFLGITVGALRTFQAFVINTYGDPRMAVDAECGPITWAWLYRVAS